MTGRERLIKGLLFLLVIVYYAGGYLPLNEFTATRTGFFHPWLPLEQEIPYVPVAVAGYILIYGLIIFTYLCVDELPLFRRLTRAFLICLTVHYLCFLLFPVEYNARPFVDSSRDLISLVTAFYYWLDRPYNCFPSLHVSNAFLIAFFLGRRHPAWRLPLCLVSAVISASVVLVKQHYIADVVAGFFVAWVVYKISRGSAI